MNIRRTEVENEILVAATKVFIEKGFKGTTIRDIAKEANISLGTMNYYFRSKENLFDIIFDKAFGQIYGSMFGSLISEKSVFDKIRDLVSSYIGVLIENPALPSFIFMEISLNPERITNKIQGGKDIMGILNKFQKQIDNEVSAGTMKSISFLELFINLESMCAFPFIAKPMLKGVFSISEMNYGAMLERRRASVADFLIDALKP